MSWRFTILQFLFILITAAVILRLGYWQVIRAEDLRSQAVSQRTTSRALVAPRGEILDSSGFPLATNQEAYALFANPQLTASISGQKLQALSEALATTESGKLLTTLTLPNRVWVPVSSGLSAAARAKVEALEISGLNFEPQALRFYPEGSTSGHLLGFVGSDENGLPQGYFGLEGFYDSQLSGVSGRMTEETDAFNRPILIGNQNYIPPQEGRTLITSIDRTLQFIIGQKLTNALQKYQAVGGTVSVMDPKTGNVLAMVSAPGYDPQKYVDFESVLYKNPVVADSYEPGSTFKVMIMAAGLDAGVIEPDTKCSICSGPVNITGYTIRTWDNKYYADSTMIDVLQHSDNVGMVFVSRRLGKDKLLSYIKDFGFGQTTGVDLQDESSPKMRASRDWYEIDLATTAFGQGIAVTPIQMLRAVGAIANRGKLMQPRLVTKIISSSGEKDLPIQKGKQIISPGAAAQVTEMMINSVDRGEAKWAKPVGFDIAGKTGTAQIPVSGHYDATKTIASFIGFAPAHDPKFAMLVTINEPKSSQWGSETAAPLWFDISKDLLRYYQIAPTR